MSKLTQDQKLVMLGLRQPSSQENASDEAIVEFQNNIASEWATFQENFEDANLGSWADFETWLTNNGISSSKASNIRSQFEASYASWSAFSDNVLNQYTSFDDMKNDFQSGSMFRSDGQTTDGRAMAGVKVYEQSGVGRDGQSIPRGGIEVFGQEVHFSQTGAVRDTRETSAGASDPIEYSNLTVSNTAPTPNQSIDISADVTNNVGYPQGVVINLLEDDVVVDTTTRVLSANETKTVTFTRSWDSITSIFVTIDGLDDTLVVVTPDGLIA